ncbi:MAG: DUF4197 domain-containing protein, partial [Mariprofundaceae bacterium]|nr:DUF4197 domain-containing protein [Mariprofundaceae bacterium]
MRLKLVWGLCVCFITSTAYANDWMHQLGSLGDSVKNIRQKIDMPQNINTALSSSDIVKGLKDALKVGSERVVNQLSQKNGFRSDAVIHIPLPDNLKRVKSLLTSIGAGSLMDDLELKLNRAAEAATPQAKKIFLNAIRNMSFQDARAILQGPNDAATTYFKGNMSQALSDEMQPIIQQTLNQVGAIQAYNRVMGKYQSMPFVPNIQANLQQHVTQGA